jgi:hypothetical protein
MRDDHDRFNLASGIDGGELVISDAGVGYNARIISSYAPVLPVAHAAAAR